ncbi:GntR family transcriptional regulator [Cellulomonas dongxiuzhuiae]|uniref:GntR family transcriptional regulator n=1 Tax=Cellulomonas dongxiuzhuiae TaxID=2819979 RepID=UPI001B02DDCE|nr:GntR family transcriptional regulator [Cellulomonas dongxiuzhuiae]MBO3089196.1 GntR family transcriptional regulator [Cellulomonas dongxiuzhuiae]MBO3095023.1 GntR family transcriptional regulator [Cellulomonas dongxiuzhuiae]
MTRRTAHEAVREELRHAILSGELAPGTPLVLTDIAEQLGTSRTPVREAIRDLVGEGLVDFDAYRTAVVHTPTLAGARETYEIRIVLEEMATRSAVGSCTAADLERAEALCDAMDATTDVGEWTELNRQFHAVLMTTVESRLLRSMIGGLRDASAVQVALALRAGGLGMREANEEHRALLQAFRDRDPEAAVERQTEHLRSTLRAVEAYESTD